MQYESPVFHKTQMQKVEPPIMDSKTPMYGVESRTLRWIYFLDPLRGLGMQRPYTQASDPLSTFGNPKRPQRNPQGPHIESSAFALEQGKVQ